MKDRLGQVSEIHLILHLMASIYFKISSKSGNHDLTIAKLLKKSNGNVALLPEAQTCDKHLYLPEYRSLAEVLYYSSNVNI